MQFLDNKQPFSRKTYMWVYIEYFLLNQLLSHLPDTDIECIVLKKLQNCFIKTWR